MVKLVYLRMSADDVEEKWGAVDRDRVVDILENNYNNPASVLDELETAAKRRRPAEFRTAFAYYKIERKE